MKDGEILNILFLKCLIYEISLQKSTMKGKDL